MVYIFIRWKIEETGWTTEPEEIGSTLYCFLTAARKSRQEVKISIWAAALNRRLNSVPGFGELFLRLVPRPKGYESRRVTNATSPPSPPVTITNTITTIIDTNSTTTTTSLFKWFRHSTCPPFLPAYLHPIHLHRLPSPPFAHPLPPAHSVRLIPLLPTASPHRRPVL